MTWNHRARASVWRGALLTAVLATVAIAAAPAWAAAEWSMSGQSYTNWRYQPAEKKLGPANVGGLHQLWATNLGGSISATPAVVDGAVYVPDWGGNISKVNAATGAIVWSKSVAALVGVTGAKSRTSPAVSGNSVIIGTQLGAYLVSLDKNTGAVQWKTQLDAHPAAIITMSPTIQAGVIYDGVASLEENMATDPNYVCCSFRGSAVAVDLKTGAIKWKTYTTVGPPPNPQAPDDRYSGAAVWGSSPAVDTKRKSVYYATGNNYTAPFSVLACEDQYRAAHPEVPPTAPDPCETQDNGNYVDALLSLDMDTGQIKWAHKLQGFDAWTVACIPGFQTSCPSPYGPDYDFGQGPMLIPTAAGDIVAAGQKAGVMWGLEADTGAIRWGTQGGPGSTLGGMQWGSATDGKRIYFQVTNLNATSRTLTNPPSDSPATSTAGLWGAIDPATGAILWQTADPNGSIDLGAPSVANGVVYVSSMRRTLFPFGGQFLLDATPGVHPSMLALDAATGRRLWTFDSGLGVNAGAAIADGTLYWGSGYSVFAPFLGDFGGQLYAFGR
jgi:polyvinyl alcohol dehydrogenase (cytochrome)